MLHWVVLCADKIFFSISKASYFFFVKCWFVWSQRIIFVFCYVFILFMNFLWFFNFEFFIDNLHDLNLFNLLIQYFNPLKFSFNLLFHFEKSSVQLPSLSRGPKISKKYSSKISTRRFRSCLSVFRFQKIFVKNLKLSFEIVFVGF